MANTSSYEKIDRPYDSRLRREKGLSYTLGGEDSLMTEGNGGASGQSGGEGSGGSVEQKTVKSGESLGDLWIKNFIRSENWKPKTQGFSIDGNSGYAEFSNVYVSGSLTLNTTSSISGGQTDFDTGIGFFLGYSGGAYKFSVGVGGTGPSLTFDGVNVNSKGANITSPGANTDISLLDYTHDITFSVLSATAVQWTSGTLTFSNGQTYAISAGNTGAMSTKTYVYFDITTPTQLSVNSSASAVVGPTKIVVAIAQNGTGEASFQVYGGAGGLKVGSSQVNIANNSWSYTGTFTATDTDTVTWSTGGILKVSSGSEYTIAAGTTYNMTAKTYIYFNLNTPTAFQTTQSASTAVGDGKVLIAVADLGTNLATFTVMNDQQRSISGTQLVSGTVANTKLVAGSITANELAAGSVTAGKIAAGAVTAGTIAAGAVVANSIQAGTITGSHLGVTTLGALKADLGTITAGTITLNTSGYIRGGQTDFNSGVGFFLGLSGGTHKFSIGDPSSSYMTWDGNSLDASNLGLAYSFEAKEDIADNAAVAVIPPTGVANSEWASVSGATTSHASKNAAHDIVPMWAVVFKTTSSASGLVYLNMGTNNVICYTSDGTYPPAMMYIIQPWDAVNDKPTGDWIEYADMVGSKPNFRFPNSGIIGLNMSVTADSYYCVSVRPKAWPSGVSGGLHGYMLAGSPTGDAEDPTLWFCDQLGEVHTQVAGNPEFSFKEKVWGSDAGKICNASAETAADGRYTGYLGISQQAISAGNSGRVSTFGISQGHPGLSVGASYYLSNTLGSISLSPGTTSRVVGRAISGTQLLMGS